MTDVSAAVLSTPPPAPLPTRTGQVAGAVTSGSIGSGLAVIVKLELNRHGFQIDDMEATAIVPLLIVVLHPLGMIVNAVVDRLVRWLSQ